VALVNRIRAGLVRFLVLAALACASFAAAAQGEVQASANNVKAAFLFKFGSYVEWPPGAMAKGEAFTIGLVEADALADELARLVKGRNVGGHPVQVRKLRVGDALDGLDVVYIGRVGRERLTALLASLRAQPTLAVTESDGALELGSMINFVVVDGKLRFDVALAAARAGSLKISSRLLGVARNVTEEPS
jgi:hypothetical protein